MTAASSSEAGGPKSSTSSLGERLHRAVLRLQQRLPFVKREAEHREQTDAQRARQRRRRRRIIVGVLVALLAYPVLGTLALWTGFVEWVLRSEDMRVEIDNPSYTIWPGRIHVKHLRVLVNGETQFALEGSDLVVDVRMRDLFRRRVHVTELAAHDVRYQMRVQVESDRGQEERIAAYPPLPDLPGAKVIREDQAAASEPREGSWTVEVEGIDIRVVELWFFEYRYLGDGRLRGGFTVGPQIMSVTTAVQDIGPGELRFGPEQVVATNFRGQVSANIPEVNPEEHADTGFFEFVTARINLRADVQSLAVAGAYLTELEVSQGQGPFAVDLLLEKGLLGPKSHLDFETEAVRVMGQGFGVQTDWRLTFDAAGEMPDGRRAPAEASAQAAPPKAGGEPSATAAPGLPVVRSSSKSTYASLAGREGREFTVHVQGHEGEAVFDSIQLSGASHLKRAEPRLPNIVSTDLDDLGAVMPEGVPLNVRGGTAKASLRLDMDENFWIRGPVELALADLDLVLAGVAISGDTKLETKLRMNPKQKFTALESMALALRNVGMHVGDEQVDGWWLNVSSPRIASWHNEPARLETDLSIRAQSLEPVLEGLAEKDKLNDLVAKFTSLDDFRAKVSLRHHGSVTDVLLASESDVWDVAGRVRATEQGTRSALVVGGQAVSVGIATSGEQLEIQPFAKTDWLNARLRQFPPPLEQLSGAKP